MPSAQELQWYKSVVHPLFSLFFLFGVKENDPECSCCCLLLTNDIFSKGGQQQQHAHLKTHYRGHHIAVWLQLIPQLHQPGGDPASYATASSYSNHHRFDRKNTPVEQFYEGICPPHFYIILSASICLIVHISFFLPFLRLDQESSASRITCPAPEMRRRAGRRLARDQRHSAGQCPSSVAVPETSSASPTISRSTPRPRVNIGRLDKFAYSSDDRRSKGLT